MRELVGDYRRLEAMGEAIGRGVVTNVWGSAPRQPGSSMLATAGGAIAGSVSGGCVESATASEIAEAIQHQRPRTIEFGVSDETAWSVGLACGGTIQILVEPNVRREFIDSLAEPCGVVVATVVQQGDSLGTSLIVRDDGSVEGPFPPSGNAAADPDVTTTLQSSLDTITQAALDALRHETSSVQRISVAEGSELEVFFEVHPKPPRLVVFGGVHVASALVTLAKPLGYRTIVADGRESFVTRDRFPDADELICAWPDEAFSQIQLDATTYVCVLSHDPKFDEPALEIALRSAAPYVGAIGSRKTQGARRQRLMDAGLTEEQVGKLKGPIGLDLGGTHPGETALAILAEITAVRYGASGGSLSK